MKTVFLHGIVAGILAGVACLAYNSAYASAMWTDFSAIIHPGSMFGGSLFGTVLASLGYFFLSKWVKKYTDAIFNVLLLVFTFASFVSPFAFQLPLDIESPELFPGLTIPMHVFPALFWLATKPLFYNQ